MKAVSKLAVLISMGAFVPLAVFAKTPEETYIETSLKAPGVPVPVAVVSPSISPDYAGAKVDVAFTVDAKGTPTGLMVVSSPDATIARAVTDAVKKWRFTPAQKDGVAVATKVVLPVRISLSERFAAN